MAVFEMLEVFTLDPKNLTSDHVRACRDTGLSEKAIMDAINVGVNFVIATRKADIFDWDIPDDDAKNDHVEFLFKRSYIRDFFFR